jgi:hypothetical protein
MLIYQRYSYEQTGWSLTLREEHRLRVFENRVLRRIFGPKRDEVIGGWRKLHNEKLHNLYSSPDIIRIIKSRRMRWAGYVARMEEKRSAYRIWVGKPKEKRPRRKWEDNIKMDLREIGWGGMYFGQSTSYQKMLYISRVNSVTSKIRKSKPCSLCGTVSASLRTHLLPARRHFKCVFKWYSWTNGPERLHHTLSRKPCG